VALSHRFAAVLAVHAGMCRCCGNRAAEVDHIVPRACGGQDAIKNLTASCRACNGVKGKRRFKPELETELLAEAFNLTPMVAELVAQMDDAASRARGRRMRHLATLSEALEGRR
jgi:hypothetical protein